MHEREAVTDAAENEFALLLLRWRAKHDLTNAETIEILSDAITRQATTQKRFDRHGRYDIKACVAPEEIKNHGN